MILFAYTRADSPFVRIRHTDESGKIVNFKTTIRTDDPQRKRKERIELNRIEKKMLLGNTKNTRVSRAENWKWVIPWLRTKYAAKSKAKTLKVYLIQWHWISLFLEEQGIDAPGVLSRPHCFAYVDWRRQQKKKSSGRFPGLNTALLELKMLGMIMREAIERGLAVENPATKLGIEKEDTREAPPMTDEEIPIVFRELKTRPEWMQRSFLLAYCTALRFSSTQIARHQVNWEREELFIPAPKGGKKKEFSIPIPPELQPMLKKWWQSGEEFLWELPPKERELTGLVWTKFFRAIGLPHLQFHSTRSTFITRGALGDPKRGIPPIPESVMMRLVNHGSKEVHRIYQRFSARDLKSFAARIPLPAIEEDPPVAAATA